MSEKLINLTGLGIFKSNLDDEVDRKISEAGAGVTYDFNKEADTLVIDGSNGYHKVIDLSNLDWVGTTEEFEYNLENGLFEPNMKCYITDDGDTIDGRIFEIDSELSYDSYNPVQNKVITRALDEKVTKISGYGLSKNDYSDEEKGRVTTLENRCDGIDAELDDKVSQSEMTTALSTTLSSANEYTDAQIAALESGVDWKESVNTFSDIATTYPNPQDGWTVNVKDTDYTYRYNGTSWVAISANAIPNATQSVDGKMSATDKTKLDSIKSWATAENKPTYGANEISGLSTVATTGQYSDVIGTPKKFEGTTAEVEAALAAGTIEIGTLVYTTDDNGTVKNNPVVVDTVVTPSSYNPVSSMAVYKLVEDMDKLSIDYKDIKNTPFIATDTSQLTNGAGFITSSAIPSSLPASDVYAWAKQSNKPQYSANEISGLSSASVDSAYKVGNSDSGYFNGWDISELKEDVSSCESDISNLETEVDSKLSLSGGTMTGSIITPANDSMGIIPASNNYGQIGSESKKFYRMYASTFYGSLNGNASTATSAYSATTASRADNADYANDAGYADNAGYADRAGSATDSSKLPLTGGTLSGTLTLPRNGLFIDTVDGAVAKGSLFCSPNSNNTINLKAPEHYSGESNYINLRAAQTQVRSSDDTGWAPIYASSYPGTSSRRYKENIQDLTEDEAKKILDIRTVSFDYKEGAVPEDGRMDQRGVIAEEVVDVIPSCVFYGDVDDETHVPVAVDYSKFTPYLIKIVQMQQNEINELKKRMEVK